MLKITGRFYENEKNFRVALILKDFSNITQYQIDLHDDKYNLIINADSDIIRGKINIIPVSLTKGLEFEKVIVFTSDLTKNEQYVACTRALEELYIVE